MREKYVISGKGTKKDPEIHQYDWFDKFFNWASFMGFKEALTYERSTGWGPTTIYYKYKILMRGNTQFDIFKSWSCLMNTIDYLKDMGYDYKTNKKLFKSLTDIKQDEVETELCKWFDSLWKQVEPKLLLKYKAGDKVKFLMGKKWVSGELIMKKNKKLYFTSKGFKRPDDEEYDNLEANEIPLFDAHPRGAHIFGAVKYNSFTKI